jgi:hypothetical protein
VEGELLKALLNAGGSAAIAIVLLVGIYRLANKFGVNFLEAHEGQTKAINRLTDTLEKFINRDQNEHREMIILLKVLTEKMEGIEDGRKKREI